MFYVILFALVGTTTAIMVKNVHPGDAKKERLAVAMKRLATKKQKDQFVCTQLDDRYAHYVYDDGDNAISVLSGPDYVTINAQHTKTQQPLIDARYDTRSRMYTEKKISKLLLKKEKEREYIEQFLKWAITTFQTEKTKQIYLGNESFSNLIKELELARNKNQLTAPIDHAFTQIIPGLAYLIEHQQLIADVDFEYQVKETLIKDLRKLLNDFTRLEKKQQEKYEHDTLIRLITVQERITQIRKHIDHTREFDLKKTLTTIDERYEH